MSLVAARSRRIWGIALLIGGVFSRVTTGQAVSPAGVQISSATPSLCQSCSEQLLARSYEPEAALPVARSRKAHILVGAVTGLAVGVYVGFLKARHYGKRCHAEGLSCASVELDDVIEGGLAGGLLGGIAGAVWPRYP